MPSLEFTPSMWNARLDVDGHADGYTHLGAAIWRNSSDGSFTVSVHVFDRRGYCGLVEHRGGAESLERARVLAQTVVFRILESGLTADEKEVRDGAHA
jgi:hypothetical protein